MNYNKATKLKNDLNKLDNKLTKIEKYLNSLELELNKEGYEITQYEGMNYIEKDGVKITEEMARTTENITLTLAVRQCIYWEYYDKKYQQTLKELDQEGIAI